MKNLKYQLALNRMKSVSINTISKLQHRWPDLENMFKLSLQQLEGEGVPLPLAQTIKAFNWREVEEDYHWQQAASDNHLISWDSPDYPSLLKEIASPPVVLYAKGQLSAFKLPQLAVVGSRNPSITGSENAKYFAKEIAAHGVCIVSGLALGIDGQAHLGCLEAQGQTIAVLGTGIDCIYPHRHLSLAQKITQNGLLLSEFPLKSPPRAGHFPRRNRIISGLALCTLVIEAAIKSGSLITAKAALEQNRDVLAIPGSIHNPLARGCHYLLQQGAKLVTTVQDVLEELKLEPRVISKGKPRISLASTNENLVKFIGFETTSIEKVISRSGFTIEQVTSGLAELELDGAISAVPGGYIRCVYER